MTVFSEEFWRAETTQPYPAPVDMTALASVIAVLDHRRDAARDAHDQLHAVGTSLGVWEGEAAHNFRGTVAKLLPNLQKAADSFGQAGQAVTTFRDAVAGLRARADVVRPRLHQAEAALSAARARGAMAILPPDTSHEREALVLVLREVGAIAGDYATLVAACVGRLEDASDAGIRNSWSTFLPAHTKGLEQISHWSGKISDWAGDAETVLLVAAAVAGASQIGLVAVPFLLGAAEVANGVGTGAGVIRVVSDVGLATAEHSAQGKTSTAKKWDVAEDALSVVVSVVGPGDKLVDGLAASQINSQRKAASAALDKKDLSGFLKADDNIGRITTAHEVGGKVAGKVVDDGIEKSGSALREGLAPEKRTTTCP